MDLRPSFIDLANPNDLLSLKKNLTEISDELDIIYTTTAPNGAISARQGRRAIYKNGSNYEEWINTDGLTTWVRTGGTTTRLWEVDGTETQLVTADEIDMQSKKIINLTDPASAQDAATKASVDANFNTTTGHDHDGSDSKKVIYTNLDLTGITNGHYLYSNAGVPAGASINTHDYAAGTYLLASQDTERTVTGDTSYHKLKEIIIVRTGGLTVKFDLNGAGVGGESAYGRVYKNGSAIGTERNLVTGYTTYSEDFTGLVPGDLIQVYAKVSSAGNTGYIRNFRIYASIPTVEVGVTDTSYP